MKINLFGSLFQNKNEPVGTPDQRLLHLVDKGKNDKLTTKELMTISEIFENCSVFSKKYLIENLLQIGKNSQLKNLEHVCQKLKKDNDPSDIKSIYSMLYLVAWVGKPEDFDQKIAKLIHKYEEGAPEPESAPVISYDGTDLFMEEYTENEINNNNPELAEGQSDVYEDSEQKDDSEGQKFV